MKTLKASKPYLRLDDFIKESLQISKNEARRLSETATLNGRKTRAGEALKIGDEVRLAMPDQNPATSGFELNILYQDEYLAVINKPSKLHSMRLRDEKEVSLSDLVDEKFPETRSHSRIGLVQRLDYFTSGVVIVCFDNSTWEEMHRKLVSGEVNKEYTALVQGRPPWKECKIDYLLIPEKNKEKVAVDKLQKCGPADALFIKVLSSENDSSVVLAKARHTSRHQVRAFLSAAGYPLLGDSVYGTHLPEGFYLHASKIEFLHPRTGENISVSSKSELVG